MELYENYPVNKHVYSNIYELLDNNPNLKQYLMQPSSEIAKTQKNINTPKSVKSQNN
jgi:hypothetical protein